MDLIYILLTTIDKYHLLKLVNRNSQQQGLIFGHLSPEYSFLIFHLTFIIPKHLTTLIANNIPINLIQLFEILLVHLSEYILVLLHFIELITIRRYCDLPFLYNVNVIYPIINLIHYFIVPVAH